MKIKGVTRGAHGRGKIVATTRNLLICRLGDLIGVLFYPLSLIFLRIVIEKGAVGDF